ncbi:ubiquitin carboxyl-terminal hydrolase, putative [Entamoeba invadens IP1]|uniref:ubiquitinyl hydrolase 1 n=1 Tax=Entamoeba invadens IP1 TaxID=370355 RepID=A0A0A1U820_ENTIV|nr:ubiquitin carboxyl-terminal hydrolase, putative [Entamoeba invadens IP1]ELP88113.1 ubiquitin carboxyl-terminal hydrolase, putative [Entamoeba invadens IP1]|eukprot:XP_004254884.1 ubiquitin carboxyl-terminal hydrolase, putative [Entamoeba invadens IP1]
MQFVVPKERPEVYKTECMYCAKSIETKLLDTLYVCLREGHCFCDECVFKHKQVSGDDLYLVIHQIPNTEPEDPIWGRTTQPDLEFWLVQTSNFEKKIEIEGLEENLKEYVKYFISCTAKEKKVEIASTRTKTYAKELTQKPRAIPIDLKNLKCEFEGCDVTDNLWLNLCDGSVLCGREQALVKGHSHALKHYDESKMPLVVKLGTIDSDGNADIYDYENDTDVTDPLLGKHLAFYGIDMSKLVKTQLSLDEIAKEAMLKMERETIEEAGVEHIPCEGPYMTGIRNNGNTCYAAAATQLLFAIPEVVDYLVSHYDTFLKENWRNVDKSCTFQLMRLAKGFVDGKCSQKFAEKGDGQIGLSITGLKRAVGFQQKMYLTNEQQDAEEFLGYLLGIVESEGLRIIDDNTKIMMCNEIKAVKSTYQKEAERTLGIMLDVPFKVLMERKHIDLNIEDMIKNYAAPSPIDNYRVDGQIVNAIRRCRVQKFPKYILIKLQRDIPISFEDMRKVDADVHGMEMLDLGILKSTGEKPQEDTKVVVNKESLGMLVSMGFDQKSSEICLKVSNNNIEVAIGILTSGEKIPEDPDTVVQHNEDNQYEELVKELVEMGFSASVSIKALQITHGNIEEAIIMAANGEVPEGEEEKPQKMEEVEVDPRSGKYECIAFVSHIGANANCGHYVCHSKQLDKWIMFNDNKVCFSQKPPFTRGFVYLYRTLD